jgi:hypothetical protein
MFDGANDYIEAPNLRLLTDEPFSVGAWVKGGAPGEVVVSQRGRANWLMASRNDGYLMTELVTVQPWGQPLSSTYKITDGSWHQVYAEWDGDLLALYVNGEQVASASAPSVNVSDSAIVVGAGKNQHGDTFWSGAIDEVRVSGTVTFSPQPPGLPLDHVMGAVASSSTSGQGPENTVNGSGLDLSDEHSTVEQDMWLSGRGAEEPAWIQYEFDRVYSLDEMWVWNHNTIAESALGLGVRLVTIELSVDGTDWVVLREDEELAQAPGAAGYGYNTVVDFEGASAKYVRLTATENWGFSGHGQFGLSEVRFFYVPTYAREPDPASGQTGVGLNVVLAWEPAPNAASHDVYLSTDLEAVLNGSAPVRNVTESRYAASPGELGYGQLYFWKVNEVLEDGATVEGDVWTFTTDYTLDDFESYTEIESERIFDVWIDGAINGTQAQVGYADAPYVERTIVYRGKQSMPIEYNNFIEPSISEVNLPLQFLNWIEGGFVALVLNVHGDPCNCSEPLYVVVEDAAGNVSVAVHPDPEILRVPRWVTWAIPLRDFTEGGVDLSRVVELTIGIGDREDPGPPSSCGPVIGALKLASANEYRIWIDEIRLQPDQTEVTYLKGTVRNALTGRGISGAGLLVHLASSGPASGGTQYWADDNGVYPWIPTAKNLAIAVTAPGFEQSTPTWEYFHIDIFRDFVLMTDPAAELSHPVYRFRSDSEPNRYYFASDEMERETLLYDNAEPDPDRWQYDGVAFCTLSPQTDPNLEVKRFVHKTAHIPAYVFSEAQLPGNRADWDDPTHFPKTAFFAYPDGMQSGTTKEVHRFWSETLTCHYYTMDQSEPGTWPSGGLWQHVDSFHVPDCPWP